MFARSKASPFVLRFAALAAALGGCHSPALETPAPEPPEPTEKSSALLVTGVDVDPAASLMINDVPVLQRFPLSRVLEQIVSQSAVPGFTGQDLFNQLWDTENPSPGLSAARPHCNTVSSPFPFSCPRFEGLQATEPGSLTKYVTTSLVNRVDLMPPDGSHCGEFRITAARQPSQQFGGRSLIIFEAVLPNPRGDLGREGCRPVQAFWRDLSSITDLNLRAARLEEFFFTGLPGFRPAIHLNNFGDAPASGGRIRTNQFLQSPWLLREFKLVSTCNATDCSLFAQPVTVKNSPHPSLFGNGAPAAETAAFQDFFVSQVENLANPNIIDIFWENRERFNPLESSAQPNQDQSALDQFQNAHPVGSPFRNRLQQELTRIGSPLPPEAIVNRAISQTCAGCHALSNNAAIGSNTSPLAFPTSADGFTHVTENIVGGPVPRFAISPALRDVFLPARLGKLNAFLSFAPAPVLAKQTLQPVVVDGHLNEAAWELLQPVTKNTVGASGNQVSYAVTWNPNFLFVGIRVQDDRLSNDSADPWQDDSAEVYLDADNNRSTSYDSFDRQFVKGWNDAGLFERAGRTSGVLSATAAIVGGYSVEFAIPWSALGVSATAGRTFGFDIAVNDDDDGIDREGQMMWNGDNNNWASTVRFGSVTLSAVTAPTNANVAKVSTPPVIDGRLSESAWALPSVATKVDKPVLGSIAGNRVTWNALWDSTGLYVGARVLDDTLFVDSADPWQDDSIELYFDGDRNRSTTYDAFDRQYVIRLDATSLFERFGRTSNVAFATSRIPGGYTVEVKVPWSELGSIPFGNRLVGFDVAFNDDDNGGNREGQAVWNGTADNWTNTSNFGTLILRE
ncbi:MAG: sugar-binding protein [Deltaproteobacteria bacterium]|nr:sugar-binding protein [Deltaproteobacteria bacterium]